MGLTYYFKFGAPAEKSPGELEVFLKSVEREAQRLGFNPTMVLNAEFQTQEQREFARRLTTGHEFESERLKGVVLLGAGQAFSHDPLSGRCRIIPERGVALIITDEKKQEAVLGFLKFPSALVDQNGLKLAETGLGNWTFQDFIKSPDPRLRKLIELFAKAGYVDEVTDDFKQ
jgi:hypothetical protein